VRRHDRATDAGHASGHADATGGRGGRVVNGILIAKTPDRSRTATYVPCPRARHSHDCQCSGTGWAYVPAHTLTRGGTDQ